MYEDRKVFGTIKFDVKPLTNKHKYHISKYSKTTCIVNLDSDYSEYYRWFIEKRFKLKLNIPIRGSHITFINEYITNEMLYSNIKSEFDNKKIELYLNIRDGIHFSNDHIWFRVSNNSRMLLSNIRLAGGLPYKYKYGFHMTIGRVNQTLKDITHFNYIKSLYKNNFVNY